MTEIPNGFERLTCSGCGKDLDVGIRKLDSPNSSSRWWCGECTDVVNGRYDMDELCRRVTRERNELRRELLHVLHRVGLGELLNAGIDPEHLRHICPGAELVGVPTREGKDDG